MKVTGKQIDELVAEIFSEIKTWGGSEEAPFSPDEVLGVRSVVSAELAKWPEPLPDDGVEPEIEPSDDLSLLGEISIRVINALNNAQIRRVSTLAKNTENHLRVIKGIGDRGISGIKNALATRGLMLAKSPDKRPARFRLLWPTMVTDWRSK